MLLLGMNHSAKRKLVDVIQSRPQVFSSQFSLIASTLSLGINNNELLFAIQKPWKKIYIKDKNIRFSPASLTVSLFYSI